jgi:hypothetical protein
MFGRKKRIVVEVRALSRERLVAAFRVPEDHPLLLGVLHLLAAGEEQALGLVVPGQSNEARRDASMALLTCRELRDEVLGLVEKANETAK